MKDTFDKLHAKMAEAHAEANAAYAEEAKALAAVQVADSNMLDANRRTINAEAVLHKLMARIMTQIEKKDGGGR